MVPADYQDCNGKMVHVPSDLFVRMEKHKEDPIDYEDDIEDVSSSFSLLLCTEQY